MKTWKHGIIGILAIIALVFALTACDNDNGKTDPVLCKCDPKVHLGIDETCKCGGTDCNNCTEQTDEYYNIPIRKVAGITVKQMNDTVAIIKTAMDSQMFDNRDLFVVNGLTEIHIISGDAVNFQNSILTVGSDPEYPPPTPNYTGTGEQAKLITILLELYEIYNIIRG